MLCVGLLVMWCQMPPQPLQAAPAGATFCQIASPIRWSPNDTRKTKEMADTHNRKGKRLCGWGK